MLLGGNVGDEMREGGFVPCRCWLRCSLVGWLCWYSSFWAGEES